MQEAANNRELVSALADGQLRGEEFAHTVEWINQTEEARLTWHTYHLVGDVLRASEPVVSARDADFLRGLKLRLQQESAPLRDVKATVLVADEQYSTGVGRQNDAKYSSANDSRFGWKMLAGFASLSTLAVIGWQMASGGGALSAAPRLAQVPVQATQPEAGSAQGGTGVDRQRMIRDPQLDALLAAHKQFGGTSALQGPAGFLRNATFEGVAP
ncbi:MAG: sigma-E factor negative regulatory protein [Rhodoferax sp.]|uniref:sigma-E factor negative regulatory protein n=1 Tax=Rhodoferax sp. TaxID=50421 RepID=UPI0013FFB166|nr:sigma-E factor negative regulatory protein [Rhodoferax sp.]NDP37387.1 sigma-E factor negative regulatory protein [Rhodoferax sp.]